MVQIHIAFTLIFLKYKWKKSWIMYDKKSCKWNWNVFPLDMKNFTVFDHRYTWGREKSVETVSCSWKLRTLTVRNAQVRITQELRSTLFVVVRNALGLTNILLLLLLCAESDYCRSVILLTFLCGECGTILCPVLESLSSMNISVWPFWEAQTLEILFEIVLILFPPSLL